MAKYLKILSENINRKMHQSGLNQAELARLADITPVYLNQIIKQTNKNPSLLYLESIANILKTTLGELLTEQGLNTEHKIEDCLEEVTKAVKKSLKTH